MSSQRRWHVRRVRRALRRRLGGAGSPAQLRARAEDAERRLAAYEVGWPPGHFYSPLPDLRDIAARQDEIWRPPPAGLPGIELRAAEQLALLERIAPLAREHPWSDEPAEGLRYHFENDYFMHPEALVLLGLLRLEPPARVVEVGSGYSSAALLDLNERFLGGSMELTFVEPYPERLRSLLRPSDDVRIVETPLQRLGHGVFDELGAGDVLLIDSTHVLKVDSDVQHLLLDIVPRLAPGVRVHFHDVYWPFEYPRHWVLEGRAWNEAYALRAFLAFNDAFRIELFTAYLSAVHPDAMRRHLPQARGAGGSSLWLRRLERGG